MRYKRSAFIFRRDLRLEDNTALRQALEMSDEVMLCFIFDPRIRRRSFSYDFMMEALKELQERADVHLFTGHPVDVIRSLDVDAVFFNRDYSPFSIMRDREIKEAFDHVHTFEDLLLYSPGSVLTKQGKPYLVFTPFYRNCMTKDVVLPVSEDVESGIRRQAFEKISEWEDYESIRDLPALDGTTRLSAHIRFGTVSIREVYHIIKEELGAGHPLIRQLHWREFFIHLAIAYPHVFKHAFKRKFDAIEWDRDDKLFEAWCSGNTGYPIVDAGMRELNATGYMHNRVRMITASFLVKDLHLDWRVGERYFASKLVDYDPCVNNGNWQWAASTGADSQPYFRIFNPKSQQKRFDPKFEYVDRWVSDRVEPIVDHFEERKRALMMFRSVA